MEGLWNNKYYRRKDYPEFPFLKNQENQGNHCTIYFNANYCPAILTPHQALG